MKYSSKPLAEILGLADMFIVASRITGTLHLSSVVARFETQMLGLPPSGRLVPKYNERPSDEKLVPQSSTVLLTVVPRLVGVSKMKGSSSG
jgi:hypothetical protein